MSEIRPQRANANRHTQRGMQALETSIATDGWIGAITVAADGETFDGSARVEKTAENGMLDNPIIVESDGTRPIVVKRVDIPSATDPRAVRLGVAANRVAALNLEWEPDVLAGILESGVDLGSLFTADEWADVALPALPEAGGGGDEFDSTPEDGPTRTQVGELWSIGGVHRLLVGDCTDPANVARLMGGERADIVFTSPPYNLGENVSISNRAASLKSGGSAYVGGGDKMTEDDYKQLLCSITDISLGIADYLLLNVQQLAGNKIALIEWLYQYRNHFADVAVWTKSNPQPAMAERVMNSAFEYIYFLSAEQKPTRAIKTASFRGTVDNVYAGSVANNEYSEIHGATFPLDFATLFVENFSQRSACDLFAGTGTLLVAAHRTNRRAYLMEISPRYADVILRRAEAEGLEVTRIDG